MKCAQVGGSEFALFAEFRRDRPEFPPEVKQKRVLIPIKDTFRPSLENDGMAHMRKGRQGGTRWPQKILNR